MTREEVTANEDAVPVGTDFDRPGTELNCPGISSDSAPWAVMPIGNIGGWVWEEEYAPRDVVCGVVVGASDSSAAAGVRTGTEDWKYSTPTTGILVEKGGDNEPEDEVVGDGAEEVRVVCSRLVCTEGVEVGAEDVVVVCSWLVSTEDGEVCGTV